MTKFEKQRERMVHKQLVSRGIKDPQVLHAMRTVPRHEFIPPLNRSKAYADGPLPIGHRQTISQPYIVARMTELLHLTSASRVLEIGTGSGYQAAILAEIAAQVITVEWHKPLATQAANRLARLGYENIQAHHGDGSAGWPQAAPYHAILIAAAAPEVPQVILNQLTIGGYLVLPVGSRKKQSLQLWQRHQLGFKSKRITAVRFVPLRGTHGWDESEWQ